MTNTEKKSFFERWENVIKALPTGPVIDAATKYLVMAEGVPYVGTVRDVYSTVTEASEAVQHYFDVGASNVAAYRCELISEEQLPSRNAP